MLLKEQSDLCVYTVCPDLSDHTVMIVELTHDKTINMTSVPSEDSDQPGRLPSLIRGFVNRMKKHWALYYLLSAQ